MPMFNPKLNGGKILWTNPSPSSNFIAGTINLNSDDYDVLEIFFKNNSGETNVMSQKTLKGYSTRLQCDISANNTIYHRFRNLTRVNDKQFTVSSGYQQTSSAGSYSQADSSIVPIYIVGYKTGLF